MKKVYLIRHGLPDFPHGNRMCIGSTDLPLGSQGFAQAEEMAKALPPVTAVFSSPLLRAVQTAQAIGLPVTILPGLRELSFGEWDGLSFQQIRQEYPALYEARGSDPNLLLPGQEDPQEGLARFREAMHQAAAAAPGDFAVVAHGGIIAQFLHSLGSSRGKPDYTETILLFWENNQFSISEAAL